MVSEAGLNETQLDCLQFAGSMPFQKPKNDVIGNAEKIFCHGRDEHHRIQEILYDTGIKKT